jgi:hypothetical protein
LIRRPLHRLQNGVSFCQHFHQNPHKNPTPLHCHVCQVDPAEDRQLNAEWGDYTTQSRSRQAEIDDLQREKEGTRRELGTIEGLIRVLIRAVAGRSHGLRLLHGDRVERKGPAVPSVTWLYTRLMMVFVESHWVGVRFDVQRCIHRVITALQGPVQGLVFPLWQLQALVLEAMLNLCLCRTVAAEAERGGTAAGGARPA